MTAPPPAPGAAPVPADDWLGEDSSLPSFSSFAHPRLPDAALAGLPGEVVRVIGPHTEADPAALLVSYLVMLGSAIGPEPALVTGADRHPARLYALIAGDSSSGRKGTAGSEIERTFARADPACHHDRIERGIQSAEALVARAGDSDDPRLLLVETEFGRLLAATARRPDLASVIKDAWDGRPLRTTTQGPQRQPPRRQRRWPTGEMTRLAVLGSDGQATRSARMETSR